MLLQLVTKCVVLHITYIFQASSSARAAEIVHGSGGFLGFGAMGGDLGYVPVTGNDDTDPAAADADFRMLFKKVIKKDSATKLKVTYLFYKSITV